MEGLRYIGEPLPRPEAAEKVAGAFGFLTDLRLPGAACAVLVRSPHAAAELTAVNSTAARALDGVYGVFFAGDVPQHRYNSAAAPKARELSQSSDMHLLTNQARFVGDRLGVVVARDRATCRAAISRLRLSWEVKTPLLDLEQAYREGAILGRVGFGDDDIDRVFDASPLVVQERFHTPASQHNCLEPHACAAFPGPGDGVTLLTNSQAPSDVRRICAEVLELPIAKVVVRKLQEGGGFGCKQEIYEEALVAWLALKLGRAVRLAHGRDEELAATRTRHEAIVQVRLGLDLDGRLRACELSALVNAGAYASHTPYVLGDIGAASVYSYGRAVHRFSCVAVATNTIPGGAYRGYGAPQANFAVEQALDIAARELGIDPGELHRRNAASEREPDPQFGAAASGRMSACIDAASARLGTPRHADPVGRARRGRGMAIATMVSVTHAGPYEASTALVGVNEDGYVSLHTGTCDCGTGSSTVLAQIVAEELGVAPARVAVYEGDTGSGLVDLGSFAQRSVYVGGAAAQAAAARARAELIQRAAGLLGRPEAGLEMGDGAVRATDEPGQSLPLAQLLDGATSGQVGLTALATARPQANVPSYAACFAEVAVGPATGMVVVERCVIAVDCGRVLNPLGAIGQVRGAVVQALGFALMEDYRVDEAGCGPSTIAEHGVPRACSVPDIEVVFCGAPEPAGPYGAKGLGEVATVPVAAAVANAIADATGVRCRRLPLRADLVWRALQGAATARDGAAT